MQLDPRTRFAVTIGYTAWIALLPIAWAPVALLPLGGVIGYLRLVRAYLAWLRWAGITVVSWFLITWLASDWLTALQASLRLLAMFTTFFLFFRTTAPEDMGNALVAMGVPYPVAFVFNAGLAFVPVLARRTREVMDAQRARGIPLEPGWRALAYYPALLIPLLAQAFTLSDRLAEALESRGFGRKGRTFIQPYHLRATDWGIMGMMALVLILTWWLR